MTLQSPPVCYPYDNNKGDLNRLDIPGHEEIHTNGSNYEDDQPLIKLKWPHHKETA